MYIKCKTQLCRNKTCRHKYPCRHDHVFEHLQVDTQNMIRGMIKRWGSFHWKFRMRTNDIWVICEAYFIEVKNVNTL